METLTEQGLSKRWVSSNDNLAESVSIVKLSSLTYSEIKSSHNIFTNTIKLSRTTYRGKNKMYFQKLHIHGVSLLSKSTLHQIKSNIKMNKSVSDFFNHEYLKRTRDPEFNGKPHLTEIFINEQNLLLMLMIINSDRADFLAEKIFLMQSVSVNSITDSRYLQFVLDNQVPATHKSYLDEHNLIYASPNYNSSNNQSLAIDSGFKHECIIKKDKIIPVQDIDRESCAGLIMDFTSAKIVSFMMHETETKFKDFDQSEINFSKKSAWDTSYSALLWFNRYRDKGVFELEDLDNFTQRELLTISTINNFVVGKYLSKESSSLKSIVMLDYIMTIDDFNRKMLDGNLDQAERLMNYIIELDSKYRDNATKLLYAVAFYLFMESECDVIDDLFSGFNNYDEKKVFMDRKKVMQIINHLMSGDLKIPLEMWLSIISDE